MEIETLKRLVAHGGAPRRRVLSAVWAIPWSGEPHLLATDGKAMILLRSPEPGFETISDEDVTLVLPFLKGADPARQVSLPRLKAWAGAPVWQTTEVCTDCHGKKRVSCRYRDHDHCGAIHDGEDGLVDCDSCRGKGELREFPVRRGTLAGHLVNRNLLACVLETSRGETVRMAPLLGPKGHPMDVFLGGDGWKAWIMGLEWLSKTRPSLPDPDFDPGTTENPETKGA